MQLFLMPLLMLCIKVIACCRHIMGSRHPLWQPLLLSLSAQQRKPHGGARFSSHQITASGLQLRPALQLSVAAEPEIGACCCPVHRQNHIQMLLKGLRWRVQRMWIDRSTRAQVPSLSAIEQLDDSKGADLTVHRHACRSPALGTPAPGTAVQQATDCRCSLLSVWTNPLHGHIGSLLTRCRPAQAASTAPCSRERHCHLAPAEGGGHGHACAAPWWTSSTWRGGAADTMGSVQT